MKKFKKWILAPIAGLAGLLPLMAAACGGEDNKKEPVNPGGSTDAQQGDQTGFARYANDAFASKKLPFDANAINKVRVGVTWSNGKAQWNALEKVIQVYNKQGKANKDRLDALNSKEESSLTEAEKAEKTKLAGYKYFLPVELVSAGTGGYGSGLDSIRTKIAAKNTSELYNLTFNYPTLASMLAKNGMLLNLNDENKALATTVDVFDSRFTRDNFTISNVLNKGTWAIPAAKSTIVTSVNGPVLAYVLETMEQNGVTIDLPSYNDIKASGVDDRDSVVGLWGAPVDNIREILGTGYTVDSSTFSVAKKLFEFAEKAQKMFTTSSDRKSSVHVLGIDDSAGIVEALGYAAIGASPYEMITKSITKQEADGTYNRVADFSPFKSEGSKIGQKMTEIYDALKSGIGTGAIVIQGNGQYTSTDSTKHRFIFGIGSTAGYSHNYTSDKDLPYLYKFLPASASGDWNKAYVFDSSSTLFKVWTQEKKISKDDNAQNKERIVISDGRHDNYVEPTTTDFTSKTKYQNFSYFANKEEYNQKVTDAIAKLKAAEKTSKSKDWNSGAYAIILSTKNNAKEIQELKAFASEHPDKFVDLGEFHHDVSETGNADNTVNIFVQIADLAHEMSDKIKFAQASTKDSLQENELFAFSAPTKWKETDPQNVVYMQGPSIIGISTNKKGDAATKLFTHFLVNGEVNAELDNMTPFIYFNKEASYINLYKGFETVDYSGLKNKFLKIAIDAFKNVVADKNSDEPTWNTYVEIPDESSDSFREALKTAYINMSNQVVNSSNGKTSGTYKTDIIDSVVSSEAALFNK